MTLTCSKVKESEEEGENGMIIGLTGRWNWEFGEKLEEGERNETSYSSYCASFLYC
jgi:hypothetical protein